MSCLIFPGSQRWDFRRAAEARTDEAGMRPARRAVRVYRPVAFVLAGCSVVPAQADDSDHLIDKWLRERLCHRRIPTWTSRHGQGFYLCAMVNHRRRRIALPPVSALHGWRHGPVSVL